MPRVAIFGAGVGGLTTAHQLSKFDNMQIDIYEKNTEIGGMARSSRDLNGCATEYCWRVYFGFYNNIFQLFREIPLLNQPNKTVANNLEVYRHTNFIDTPPIWRDNLRAFYSILSGITSCDARLEKLDNITWWSALGTGDSSSLFREIGGWLGMDRFYGSFNSVIKVGMEMQMFPAYLNPTYRDYITNQPTSEAWFQHWQHYLTKQKQNVAIHLQHELLTVNFDCDNKIASIVVKDNYNNKIKLVEADYYIFSLPVNILSKIVRQTTQLNQYQLAKIPQLSESCLHIQLSFQIYFNRQISLGKDEKTNAFLIVDSPWDIIVLSYDQAFAPQQLCRKAPQAKGGWSVAGCTAYKKGILFGKQMNRCSYQEIIAELEAQMWRSKTLRRRVRNNNPFKLDRNMILGWSPMWPSYYYSGGKLTTTEPKFTNNAGSLALRPSYKTHISNLYLATAYIRETIDIYSMEAAAIAGKRVAHEIAGHSPVPVINPRPIYLLPFRAIDIIAYALGLPNINPMGIMILFVVVIIFLIYKLPNVI